MKSIILKIAICAIIIYFIAYACFDFNEYLYYNTDYFTNWEEWKYVSLIAAIYFAIVVLFILFVFFVRMIINHKTVIVNYFEHLFKAMRIKGAPENNRNWLGTGIVGMTTYVKFCLIIGWACCALGAVLLLVSAMKLSVDDLEQNIWCVYSGLFFIIGGINCIILTPFIKALITITKAATKYLHNNQ